MAALLKGIANVFGGYTHTAGPSKEELQRAFENFCSPPPRDEKATGPVRIPSTNFVHITESLKQLEKLNHVEGWATRPRIFTILFGISRTHFMPIFIRQGFTDFHLPFAIHDLPHELGEQRYKFFEFQRHVESPAKDIELGVSGHHVSLRSGDDHFITVKYVGAGGFGGVDVVWSRLSHRNYARKQFKRGGNRRDDQEKFTTFVREISALKRLSHKHKHLVRIIGSYTDSSSFAFLMQPVADSNLKSYLDNIDATHFPALRSFFGCLANAIAYLHSKKIHHMDIKLENFLVKRGEIFVADFGSAHDWSKKDRSKTWAPMPATERYKPPELARDPFAAKNSATDIWSLGIVFLEMVSVLRGKSISQFREFLKRQGTGHQFVYANSPGTALWTAEIQQKGKGPESDNEPLQWVHDMTRPHPIDRPTARNLMDIILNSPSAEHFRRICCAEMEDRWYEDLPLQDATQQHFEPEFDEESIFIQELLAEDAKHAEVQLQANTKSQSIQAWLNHDVGNLPTDHREEVIEHTDADDDEVQFEFEEDEEEEEELTQVPVANRPIFSQVPSRLSHFDFLDQEPQMPHPSREWGEYEDDDMAFEVESDGCTSKYSEVTLRPFEIEEDIPEEADEEFEIAEDESEIPRSDMATTTHCETSAQTKPSMKVEDPRNTPPIPPMATPVKAHIEVYHSKGVHFNLPDSSANRKEQSRDEAKPKNQHKTISFNGAPAQTPSLAADDNSRTPDKQTTEETRDASLETSHESLLGGSKQASSRPDHKATKQYSTKEKGPPSSATNKGTPKLTLENLTFLNSSSNSTSKPEPTLTTKGAKTTSKVKGVTISAAKYIQEIYEAESSAATSVVSETTKAKLSGTAGMTRYQDKSFNIVGKYTKDGASGAVRLLMEKGCNPGTKVSATLDMDQ